MADIKFSELSTLAAADVASADVLAVVDTSATASKKLTINNLFGAVPVNIAVVDTTASSSNTTGSITTTGGVGVSGSVVVGTDLTIHGDADIDGTTNLDVVDIDGAVQIDAAVTVGVDDTGHDVKFFGATTGQFLLWDQSADELALVGDTKLSFHDAAGGENIVASADGHLEINSATTLDITAPTVDINVSTTLNVDGVTQLTGDVTVGVDGTGLDVTFYGDTSGKHLLWDQSGDELLFATSTKLSFHDAAGGENILASADGHLEVNAGTTLDITAPTVDINVATTLNVDGVVQLTGTVTVGVDDTGHDVKFFGATTGAYLQWDESVDDLILGGAARAVVPEGQLVLGSTAVTTTAAELNLLDGVTQTTAEINAHTSPGDVMALAIALG